MITCNNGWRKLKQIDPILCLISCCYYFAFWYTILWFNVFHLYVMHTSIIRFINIYLEGGKRLYYFYHKDPRSYGHWCMEQRGIRLKYTYDFDQGYPVIKWVNGLNSIDPTIPSLKALSSLRTLHTLLIESRAQQAHYLKIIYQSLEKSRNITCGVIFELHFWKQIEFPLKQHVTVFFNFILHVMNISFTTTSRIP